MREQVFSSVGAQDTTRGDTNYPIYIDFSWKDLEVDMDSVYRPGNGNPFFLCIFDDFQMEEVSTTANPKIINDEEDNENSAPSATTPESQRPAEPPKTTEKLPIRGLTRKCA